MKRFKLNLIAGENNIIAVSGDYFRVIAGSAEFEIQPDTSQRLAGFLSGMAYTAPKAFTTLNIKSDVNQSIDIMAGLGRVDDNRSSISGVVDTAGRGLTISNAGHVVGVAAAQLLAADITRRSVIIANEDASNAIYIGADATVTAANGLQVAGGQSLVITQSAAAAIFAIGAAAGLVVKTLSELD